MSERVPQTVGLDRVTARARATVRYRVELAAPLTERQLVTCALLAEGYSPRMAAAVVGCTLRTVRFHIRRAAAKIPGDLRPIFRIIAWYRGADLAVLTGRYVHDPLPAVTDVAAEPAPVSSLADAASSPPTREVPHGG